MIRLLSGSLVIRVAGAVLQVLLTLAVARAAGASQAGLFFFGYALLMILATLARLGTEVSALRDVARLLAAGDVRAVRAHVRARLTLVLVAGVLLAGGLAVVSPVVADHTLGPQVLPSVRLSALSIPALAVVGLMSEVLKGGGRAWLALVVQNVAMPTVALAVIGLVDAFGRPTGTSMSAAVCGACWLTAGLALTAWWTARSADQGPAGPSPTPPWSRSRTLLHEAPSLLVVSMTPIAMAWVGATLLGVFAPASTVAAYSVATRLSIAVSIVHSAASSVVGPRMAVAAETHDHGLSTRLAHRTAVAISILTLPVLVAMAVLSAPLMAVFGQEYRADGDILLVLLAGQVCAALIGHSGTVVVMSGRYALGRRICLLAATSTLVLCAVLIPAAGAIGAAGALATSVTIGHVAALLAVRRHLGFWPVPVSGADLRGAVGAGRS